MAVLQFVVLEDSPSNCHYWKVDRCEYKKEGANEDSRSCTCPCLSLTAATTMRTATTSRSSLRTICRARPRVLLWRTRTFSRLLPSDETRTSLHGLNRWVIYARSSSLIPTPTPSPESEQWPFPTSIFVPLPRPPRPFALVRATPTPSPATPTFPPYPTCLLPTLAGARAPSAFSVTSS